MIRKTVVRFVGAVAMFMLLAVVYVQSQADQSEEVSTTEVPDVYPEELPEPQNVVPNARPWPHLPVLASTKTKDGNSVNILIIPGDHDMIALAHPLVFPEGAIRMNKGGPFATVSFLREKDSPGPAQLPLTVKRDDKIVAEIKLKPGDRSLVKLSGIKPKGDSLKWYLDGSDSKHNDSLTLTMCGSEEGLVNYIVKIK